jgi:hypothetical protein
MWNVYTVDSDIKRSKMEFNKLKAKVNAIKEIIYKGEDQVLADELKVNTVELEVSDKSHITEAIKKYTNYKPSRTSVTSFSFSFSQPALVVEEETSQENNESESITPTTTVTTGGWGSNTSSFSTEEVTGEG